MTHVIHPSYFSDIPSLDDKHPQLRQVANVMNNVRITSGRKRAGEPYDIDALPMAEVSLEELKSLQSMF
jgi:hypothetical protein